MADYVKKINDLLALAESPNENEARAALLKARELMAKYKISEDMVEGAEKKDVVRKMTSVSYSARRDPWAGLLSDVIAKNHCCKNFNAREKGRQTAEIGFVGFVDDAAVCVDVFKYAVDCIQSVTKKLKRTHSTKIANSYGFGFVFGLNEAYLKQQKENDWGLVLVAPKEVNENMKGMKKGPSTAAKKINQSDVQTFRKGIVDGRRFKEQKRIAEGNV